MSSLTRLKQFLRRTAIGMSVVIAVLAAPTRSFAQPGSEAGTEDSAEEGSGGDRKAAAEALFAEAVALADQGQLTAACSKFEASESLDVAVGTLLHLADCYERNGRLASAWARFREAQSLAEAQSMPDRERIASMRAAALEPKLARVTIAVPARIPRGLLVRLGGTPVPRASWGSALPFDPGVVTLEATAPGHHAFRKQVTIPSEVAARVTIEVPALRAAPVAAPFGASAASDTGVVARTVGITTAVIGGVGLAGGGVFTYLAKERNDASLEQCPRSPTLCSPDGVEKRKEAGRFADFATVSAAVGGGLVVTGLVLYLTAPRKRAEERASIRLTPELGPERWSLGAGGAF